MGSWRHRCHGIDACELVHVAICRIDGNSLTKHGSSDNLHLSSDQDFNLSRIKQTELVEFDEAGVDNLAKVLMLSKEEADLKGTDNLVHMNSRY